MKNKGRISIKDISKELGISTTTISFIINKKAENRISKEVIQKVEDYIRKVGYIPNSSAQTLRTGKSKTIVFMAEDISDPFFSAIAKEMEDIAFKNGYKIIYCSTENKKERALELLTLFKERQVDAFIITPPEGFRDEIEKLIEEKQIVMVFDRLYEDLNHNYVVLNNFESARNATAYLLKQGFQNVGFVGLESDISPTVQRWNGYRETIYKHGLKERSVLIPYDQVKTSNGRELIKDFLSKNPETDSLLFATNSLAITGIRVLKDMALKIPDDISVITFDDRDLFELYSPSISVVSQPVRKLANELIRGTLTLLKGNIKNSVKFKRILEGKLIERDSSQFLS